MAKEPGGRAAGNRPLIRSVLLSQKSIKPIEQCLLCLLPLSTRESMSRPWHHDQFTLRPRFLHGLMESLAVRDRHQFVLVPMNQQRRAQTAL